MGCAGDKWRGPDDRAGGLRGATERGTAFGVRVDLRELEVRRSFSLLAVNLFVLSAWNLSFLVENVRGEVPYVPVRGMVTMVDLGANQCIPCKLMAPILERLERRYRGKAAIVVIDVWKYREQAQRFRIRAIPTQIFFDRDGKEVYRHEGFMSEKDIVDHLRRMGVP